MPRFGLFSTLTASHLFLVQCLQPLVQFLNLLFQSCSVFLYLFQLCLQFGQFILLLRTLGAEISRFLFHKIQVGRQLPVRDRQAFLFFKQLLNIHSRKSLDQMLSKFIHMFNPSKELDLFQYLMS